MNSKDKTYDITIKYNDDEEAKDRFINFIVDYFLEKDLNRKVGIDD